MILEKDKANFKELIEQVKQAKEAQKLEIASDAEIAKEIKSKLSSKDRIYFLRAFGLDDGDLDQQEFELIDWILFDLFEKKDEQLKQRIEVMSS